MTKLCDHIGVSSSAVGFVIGCCDIATIPGTLGTPSPPRCLQQPANLPGKQRLVEASWATLLNTQPWASLLAAAYA